VVIEEVAYALRFLASDFKRQKEAEKEKAEKEKVERERAELKTVGREKVQRV
jgi:hypothetical protein